MTSRDVRVGPVAVRGPWLLRRASQSPRGIVLRRTDPLPLLDDLPRAPWVVKPADADNSAGLSLVHRARQLPDAIELAFEHSDQVLVEQFVELGREVRCGVLDDGDGLRVLPLEEYAVDPITKPIRDGADKLATTSSGLALVAKDDAHAHIVAVPAAERQVRGSRGRRNPLHDRIVSYSLFDFRIDPSGQPWFLEAGLYCSFARQSVLAVMAAADGVTVAELFARTVNVALAGGP